MFTQALANLSRSCLSFITAITGQKVANNALIGASARYLPPTSNQIKQPRITYYIHTCFCIRDVNEASSLCRPRLAIIHKPQSTDNPQAIDTDVLTAAAFSWGLFIF